MRLRFSAKTIIQSLDKTVKLTSVMSFVVVIREDISMLAIVSATSVR